MATNDMASAENVAAAIKAAVVTPLALPPPTQTAARTDVLRLAVEQLVPRDALDARVRRGETISPSEAAEVRARRTKVQRKCLQLAATVDGAAAQEFLRVAHWLESPPAPAAVDKHMIEVGLVREASMPAPDHRTRPVTILRPELGTAGRRAAHSALLAFKDAAPSSCASRLFDIAMTLARQFEWSKHEPSGSSHTEIVGLIRLA